MISRIAVVPVLVSLSVAAAGREPVQPPPAASRTIVVIGDLHMGEGRQPSGAWRAREDFRWSDEFSRFLGAIDAEGRSSVDLVLNGDTFDLLESSGSACADAAAGCSEAEMSNRLERVLAAHDGDLKSLARFASTGANRLIIVPGDHDAGLLFPRLRRRVVEALPASGGRVELTPSGNWISADRRVLVEHGHQVGPDTGERAGKPTPELQNLLGQLEDRYPIVDNMAAAGVGVKYTLPGDGTLDAGIFATLLRALLLTTPWQQFRMELDDGEVEPPVWDLALVREQGASFFTSSIPDDDPFKPQVAKAAASGALAPLIDRWSDDELVAVCDYRAAVRRARRRFEPLVTQFAPRGPAVAECPRTPETRGARFDYFWGSRDRIFGRHVEAEAARMKARIAVLVQSHTHLPDRSQNNANMISGGLLKIPMEGFSPVRGSLSPVVINTGAWQRTITPVQYERLRASRSVSDDELLRSLQPEELAPCYSFVRIPPYEESPSPAVRYWRQSGTDWRIAENCGT